MSASWLSRSVVPAERKLAGIHGLRALAALMIVIFHTYGIPKLQIPGWLWLVSDRFGLGVQLFFLLSAFSLAHSANVSGSDLRSYWIKRFFRIAPLFYVMLAWYQLWLGPRPVSENVLNALFVFNLIPSASQGIVWASWAIGVEMIFYLLLPLLLALGANLVSVVGLTVAALAISIFGRMQLEALHELPASYPHIAFVSNLGIFCLGILAYRLYAKGMFRDHRLLAAAFLVAAAAVLGPIRALALPDRLDITAWALMFALLTLWQALRPSLLLRNPFAQFLGERSYSIYLLHPFIVYMLRDAYAGIYQATAMPGLAFAACALLTIAITVVCADFTYRCIEAPGIRLGNRLNRRLARLS
jgi:peptidoglycan/LPS O-acetylase OafA/YrhL